MDPANSELLDNFMRQHSSRLHPQGFLENQIGNVLTKKIRAPVSAVWAIVRRFDEPQTYQPFVRSCVTHGEIREGMTREVRDAWSKSTEVLELLDDDRHILAYRVLATDSRLKNYGSTLSLHPEVIDGKEGTLVVESYMVDVPQVFTEEETRSSVESVIKCNFRLLKQIAEIRRRP